MCTTFSGTHVRTVRTGSYAPVIAWSFRVISHSDEKPRSVHLPVLVLGRESKGHIPLMYN